MSVITVLIRGCIKGEARGAGKNVGKRQFPWAESDREV